jgi:hypothetical protein
MRKLACWHTGGNEKRSRTKCGVLLSCLGNKPHLRGTPRAQRARQSPTGYLKRDSSESFFMPKPFVLLVFWTLL